MSLRPNARTDRSSSKTRERSRSRGDVRAPSPPSTALVAASRRTSRRKKVEESSSSSGSEESDEDEKPTARRRGEPDISSTMPGGFNAGGVSQYEVKTDHLSRVSTLPTAKHAYAREEDYKDLPPHQRPDYHRASSSSAYHIPGAGALQYLQDEAAKKMGYSRPLQSPPAQPEGYAQHGPRQYADHGEWKYAAPPEQIKYTRQPSISSQGVPHTTKAMERHESFTRTSEPVNRHGSVQEPGYPPYQYRQGPHGAVMPAAEYVEVAPSGYHDARRGSHRPSMSERDNSYLSYQQHPHPSVGGHEGSYQHHQTSPPPPHGDYRGYGGLGPEQYMTSGSRLSVDERGSHSNHRTPSPGVAQGGHSPGLMAGLGGAIGGALSAGMSRLSVGGGEHMPHMPGGMPGGLPPGSPLLEAYRGTYQEISPMPSPIMMPHMPDLDLSELEPLSHHSTRDSKHDKDKDKKHRRKSESRSESVSETVVVSPTTHKKRVQLYDAETDVEVLIPALKGKEADADVLIDVLPRLSHDQMVELRNEYKKHCKVQGKGVNIAKHIKMKTTGTFGKFCYVTALGRFESEAYWANSWYQSHGSRRELLIEALMGRSNAEIRLIKDAFKDKRYNDDLVRCMEKELKADKFRKAVLITLEESRQEESEILPPEYIVKDVDILRKSLKAKEGGETAMLQIVLTRSDHHLRDVLRAYDKKYQENFAKAALKKSNNLVGEVMAHILNGVINRPARDCLLLHHAVTDITDKTIDMRYELLISRLVRLHWDRPHLVLVKREYKDRYGKSLEREIDGIAKGEWGDFALALIET